MKFKNSNRDIYREECPSFTDLNDEKDESVFFDLNNKNNIINLKYLKYLLIFKYKNYMKVSTFMCIFIK